MPQFQHELTNPPAVGASGNERLMNPHNEEQARIGRGLSRIPSGCAILTARAGDLRTGMLASWVQQAAMEPPMISVAVKRGRPIERLIDESRAFVVNLLGEEPKAMFKHFGRGLSLQDDAFDGIEASEIDGGVVIADQIAWLSARVVGKHEAGDHWIYLGEVLGAGCDELRPPYVHIRRNGFSY